MSEINPPANTPNRFAFRAIPIALLLIQALLLAYLSWSTSPNRTEVGHLGAAVYLWHTGKFDVFHVNPPLVRAVAGAPIVLLASPPDNAKPTSAQSQSSWQPQRGVALSTFFP